MAPEKAPALPLWLKVSYTAFMAVLIPVYWYHYGPTNFLYFCDVALILTLIGLWTENALLLSMCAVGILAPQALWNVDFFANLIGFKLTGLTDYMFDSQRSLFLRLLSLFHGWLPFLLAFLVWKIGYDRRALPVWTAVAWALMLICFFFMPPPHPGSSTPVNINYVWGMSDSAPQTWMSATAWIVGMMIILPVLLFAPVHYLLAHTMRAPLPRARRIAS
jgi:hypothetical protein